MEGSTSNQTKARLIVLAVFILGIAFGALSMNLYVRATAPGKTGNGSRKPQDYIVKKLNDRLKLTSDQQTRIRVLLDETFAKYREIYKDIEPRMDEVRHQERDRLRQVLTPEQLPEFEKMVQEREALRQKWNENK